MLLASVSLLSCKKSSTPSNPATIPNSSTVYGQFSATLDSAANPITGGSYHCFIDTFQNAQYLYLTAGTNDGVYILSFTVPISSIIPSLGSYSDWSMEIMYDDNLSQPSYNFYNAQIGYGHSRLISFDLTSYDQSTEMFSATYSCVLDDGNGNLHYITNGTINGKLILII